MFSFFRWRRPFLDLEFSSGEHTRARVIEFPGLWMSPASLEGLFLDLKKIVNEAGLAGLSYGLFSGDREFLNRAILTIIYDRSQGKPIAFNALMALDCNLRGRPQRVIHLGLVVIDPAYRAKGLSWVLYGFTTFLIFFKNGFRPIWVSSVTQVPAIVGSISESFDHVYPNPKLKTHRSYDHLVLAKEIMGRHRPFFGVGPEAQFDEDSFVIRKAYTGGSENLKKDFSSAPKHRHQIFNDYCQEQIDYDRGDDILQIGRITLRAYYNYMIHSVPAESRKNLLYKLFFAAIEFSLVPLFQWFSPRHQMGVLRARTGVASLLRGNRKSGDSQ